MQEDDDFAEELGEHDDDLSPILRGDCVFQVLIEDGDFGEEGERDASDQIVDY